MKNLSAVLPLILLFTITAFVQLSCKKKKPKWGVEVRVLNELTGEPYAYFDVTLLDRFEFLGYGGIATYGKTDANGLAKFDVELESGKLYEIKIDLLPDTEGTYPHEFNATSASYFYTFKLRERGKVDLKLINTSEETYGTDSLFYRFRHEKLTFSEFERANFGNQQESNDFYAYAGKNYFEFKLVRNGTTSFFTRELIVKKGLVPENKFDIYY